MQKIPTTITFRKSRSQLNQLWLKKLQHCSVLAFGDDCSIIQVVAPSALPPRINAFCPLWFDLDTNTWIGSFNSAVIPPTEACLFVDGVIKGHIAPNIMFRFGS